jgi:hypothetical protein
MSALATNGALVSTTPHVISQNFMKQIELQNIRSGSASHFKKSRAHASIRKDGIAFERVSEKSAIDERSQRSPKILLGREVSGANPVEITQQPGEAAGTPDMDYQRISKREERQTKSELQHIESKKTAQHTEAKNCNELANALPQRTISKNLGNNLKVSRTCVQEEITIVKRVGRLKLKETWCITKFIREQETIGLHISIKTSSGWSENEKLNAGRNQNDIREKKISIFDALEEKVIYNVECLKTADTMRIHNTNEWMQGKNEVVTSRRTPPGENRIENLNTDCSGDKRNITKNGKRKTLIKVNLASCKGAQFQNTKASENKNNTENPITVRITTIQDNKITNYFAKKQRQAPKRKVNEMQTEEVEKMEMTYRKQSLSNKKAKNEHTKSTEASLERELGAGKKQKENLQENPRQTNQGYQMPPQPQSGQTQTRKNDPRNMPIYYCNVNHLHKRIDEIRNNISKRHDILILAETWLNETTDNKEIAIQGFATHRKDSSDGVKARGVCVYVRQTIDCVPRPDLQTTNLANLMWLHIKGDHKTNGFLIGALYRSPSVNGEWIEDLAQAVEQVQLRTDLPIILIGDFNVNLSKEVASQGKKQLMETTENLKLAQLVTDYTRITEKTKSLIDHVYVSNAIANEIKITVENGLSDHRAIIVSYPIGRKPIQKQPRPKLFGRSYKTFDPQNFDKDLKKALEETVKANNVNAKSKEIAEAVIKTLNEHAPVRKVKNIKSKQWWNKEIDSLIKRRDQAREQHARTKCPKAWEFYKRLRTQTQRKIEETKKKTFRLRCVQAAIDKPASFWKALPEICPGILKEKNREAETWTEQKLNEMNEIFLEVPAAARPDENGTGKIEERKMERRDSEAFKPQQKRNQNKEQFRFEPTNEEKVQNIINKLETNKAFGHDGIPSKIIKAAKSLTPYITELINDSLKTGVVPGNMKIAKVTPIPKPGTKQEYRPVAVLTIISKIMEKVVAEQVTNYLEQNNLMDERQCGFRKGRSCSTALHIATESWIQALDSDRYIAVASLDLSKAFDCIDHEQIARRLSEDNFGENAIRWFSSYLSEREQYTEKDGITSKTQKSRYKCGVPQGSVLGPLLFNIAVARINSTLDKEKASYVSYADDTQLWVIGKEIGTITNELSGHIMSLKHFYKQIGLRLNESKTTYMVIAPASKQKNTEIPNLILGTETIKPSSKMKVLGVTIDNNLNWRDHTDKIVNQCRNKIIQLGRINRKLRLSITERKSLYYALVSSKVHYCDTVWGNTNKRNVGKIEKIQNLGMRMIVGAKSNNEYSREQLRERLKWITAESKVEIHKLCLIHTILKSDRMPSALRESIRTADHGLNTRHKGINLDLPAAKKSVSQQSIAFGMAREWNKLPNALKQIDNFSKFHSKLLSYFEIKERQCVIKSRQALITGCNAAPVL